MPGLDRTGPVGGGPMTGGGRGLCNPANVGASQPVAAGSGRRSRSGSEFGRRRVRCRTRWQAIAFGADRPLEPTAEIDKLQVEADSLANMLDRLSQQIEALRAVKSHRQKGAGSG